MSTVLLVDDEPAMLEAVGNMLGSRGWEVVTSTNGTDAVARAAERHFDLVLSDVVMEGVVGTALVDEIHASRHNQTTPVVFMSNMAERRVRSVIRREFAFLPKPFGIEQLMGTLAAVLDRGEGWAGAHGERERSSGGYAAR